MAEQLCEDTKGHWTVGFKWVNCMCCELCLYKAIEKKKPSLEGCLKN